MCEITMLDVLELETKAGFLIKISIFCEQERRKQLESDLA